MTNHTASAILLAVFLESIGTCKKELLTVYQDCKGVRLGGSPRRSEIMKQLPLIRFCHPPVPRGSPRRSEIMKQLYFLYIFTFLLVITVSNGTADTIEKVFQNFKAAYEKSKNFSANFEETTLQAGNKSVARGRLRFSKPNLLRKEYVSHKDPTQLAQLIVLDGDFLLGVHAVTQPSE